MGVRPLCAGFHLALVIPLRIVSLGVVNGSATRHFTLMSSSSYLLVLALAVTAVIAAVVIYFAARHLQRVFLDKGQPKAR